jgi:hypothetical protein
MMGTLIEFGALVIWGAALLCAWRAWGEYDRYDREDFYEWVTMAMRIALVAIAMFAIGHWW